MAERLTKKDIDYQSFVLKDKNDILIYPPESDALKSDIMGEAITKLGKLEDVMERYGIESVELLEATLKMKSQSLKGFEKLQQDRDTWKKACELACKETSCHCPFPPDKYNAQKEYGSDEPYWIEEGGCEFDSPERCLECTINYFYQQAKEGKKND